MKFKNPFMLRRTHERMIRHVIDGQAQLTELELRPDHLHVGVKHWAVRLLATSMAKSLNDGNLKYITSSVTHPDVGEMELTLRRLGPGERTPAGDIRKLRDVLSQFEAPPELTGELVDRIEALITRLAQSPSGQSAA